MRETEAIIERVKRVNSDFQHIELAVDRYLTTLKPGQSLLARRYADSWHPYLRERWWPVDILDDGKLVVERPVDEDYQPGQLVNLLGLIGQPYRFRRTLRNVLLVAHNIPPTAMLLMVPWLLANKISVTMVLLGTARGYTTQHVAQEVEIVLGDDDKDSLSWPNQVMTVGWADQVFAAVGHPGEYKAVLDRFQERRNDLPPNYLFGVFDPMLPCGAGACYACVLQTRKGNSLVCTDGPAYDLTQVVF